MFLMSICLIKVDTWKPTGWLSVLITMDNHSIIIACTHSIHTHLCSMGLETSCSYNVSSFYVLLIFKWNCNVEILLKIPKADCVAFYYRVSALVDAE